MSSRRVQEPLGKLAEVHESLRADFAAARESRFRRKRSGIPSLGASADWHWKSESEWLKIIEGSRDMARNDIIVGPCVERSRVNVLQGGPGLNPMTGNKAFDTAAWQFWEDWSGDPARCDVAGENTFAQISDVAFDQFLIDGDHWGLGTVGGQIQCFEADQVRTANRTKRNIVYGVELSPLRQRERIWVLPRAVDPFVTIKIGDLTSYDFRDDDGHRQVFQLYDPRRATQTRGVTANQPIFDLCAQFEDVNFAKIVQQQVASCIAFLLETETNGRAPDLGKTTQTGLLGVQTVDDMQRILAELQPGMLLSPPAGTKVQGFSPNVPNQEFFAHVRLMLQLIGLNYGLPLVVLLMDASETNFSGWRGAVEEAKKSWKRLQRVVRDRWFAPIYRWRLRKAIGEGELKVPKSVRDPLAHQWTMPTWPYIQPLQDSQTSSFRIRTLLVSPRRGHAELGQDFETIVEETVADNSFAILAAKKAAAAINAAYPNDEPVGWRDCLSLPMPDGVRLSLSGGNDEPAKSKPAKGDGDE